MLRNRARSIQKDQRMGQLASDGQSGTYLQSEIAGQKQKTHSFFNAPSLFVGLTPKCMLDCDSVRSPTSSLDFKFVLNSGSSFRFPKSFDDGHQKSRDSNKKVGLSLVDSLDDDGRRLGGKVISSSNSKNILFGSQVRRRNPNFPACVNLCEAPESMPENYLLFHHTQTKASNLQKGKSDILFEMGEGSLEPDMSVKIQSFSLDSNRCGAPIYSFGHRRLIPSANRSSSCTTIGVSSPSTMAVGSPDVEEDSKVDELGTVPMRIFGSSNEFICSISAGEIELSEDYTCVISHGPNPKTTHIFGDCILGGHASSATISENKREGLEIDVSCGNKGAEISSQCASSDFLSFCYFCNKKLEEDMDIFMYRGEKTFCSLDCRLEEILIEEGNENSVEAPKGSPESRDGQEIFENSLFLAI